LSDARPRRDPDATKTSHDRNHVLAADTLVSGRYRIQELVGVGAMGMVYRALDERLKVVVALKVLRLERAPDLRRLERFEHELVLARQVTHRNVVRIHDIGQDGDLHFLTMDYVQGRSLKEMLEERGHLEVGQVVSIAHDLALALAAAHREDIVHRDLKPANVLVDQDGRAYVTDFGVARSLNQAGLTQAGVVIGTLGYLAPEQARGGNLDGRTDLYALGLIMFEMLTGKLPFTGETFEEVLAQRTTGKPRELSDEGVHAPAWLSRLLARCLERDPALRYPDADALAADLVAGQSRRSLRRWLLRGAAVVSGLLVAAAVFVLYRQFAAAPATAAGAVDVVAILPLANQTVGSAQHAWLSSGLAEMLAQGLAESTDLQVVDSLRVFRTIDDLQLRPERLAEHDLRRLAELLDVERVVTGSIREAGGRVRVELRLIDVREPDAPPQLLHEEAVSAGETFRLVDRLGAQLRRAFAVDPATPSPQILSDQPAAMAAYTQGMHRLREGDSVKAVPALETAVELDPDFPAAWVRLSTAYEQLGFDEKAREAARQGVAHLGEGAGRIGLEARAREAVLSGDFERAQQLLGGLIERYPHDIEARVALAEAFGEHGQLERARQELSKIVAASPNHPRAWYLLGKYAILAGDRRAAADEYLVRALVIQNKLGNLQGRADVENALGIAHFQLGQLDQAAERYRNAIELRRRIGDQRGVAAATANVARIDLRKGDFNRAHAGLQQALQVVEGIGDRQTVANLHNEIGSLEEQRGDYRAALERYRRALSELRDLGNQRALAESYNNVGFAYLLLGDFSNAEVYAAQAVQLYRRTENREGVMLAQQTVGLLEVARGDWNAAEKALLEVLQLSRELSDPLAEAVALGNLGRIAQYQGRFGAAQRSYDNALTVLEPLENPRAQAEFTLYRAELAFDLGMNEAGNEGLKQVAAWLPQGENREQKAEWLRLTGIGQLRAGERAAARKSFAAALSEAEASGSILARLASGIAAAEAQLDNRETQPARAALESLQSQAQTLGHAMLQLESGELLARAHVASRNWAAAERELRSSLRLADTLRLYSDRYRLHALLGDAFTAQGKDVAAAEQRRAAAAELQRLREALDESQRDAFDRLTEVRRLARQDAVKPAA